MSFLDKKKDRYKAIVGDTEEYREEVEEELSKESATLEEGFNLVVERKYPIPKIDDEIMEELDFPVDISGLTDDVLLEQMSKWTLMIDYMQFELAMADIDRIAKRNRYDIEKSKYYIDAVEEGGISQKMADHYATIDPYLQMLLKASDVANAKHTLVDALLKGYNQNYKLLSRELTKRGLYNPSQDNQRKVKE